MATTTTALSGAIGPSDWQVKLVNQANLKAGDTISVPATASTEAMRVLVAEPGQPAIVYRGSEGTKGAAWADAQTAIYGQGTDFLPGVGALRAAPPDLQPFLEEIKSEREAKQLEADLKDAEARAKKAADEQEKAARVEPPKVEKR